MSFQCSGIFTDKLLFYQHVTNLENVIQANCSQNVAGMPANDVIAGFGYFNASCQLPKISLLRHLCRIFASVVLILNKKSFDILL